MTETFPRDSETQAGTEPGCRTEQTQGFTGPQQHLEGHWLMGKKRVRASDIGSHEAEFRATSGATWGENAPVSEQLSLGRRERKRWDRRQEL